MTRLLATFFATSDEPNRRGELDGSAWRFVLPGEVDVVEVRPPATLGDRDLGALQRCATVVRSGDDVDAAGPLEQRSRLVVGPSVGSDTTSLGIDLNRSEVGHPVEFRYTDDELRGVVPAADDIARAVLAPHLGPDGPVPRSWKQRIRRDRVRTRRTVVGSVRGMPGGPPAWIVEGAAAAGVDVSEFGWALWCRGEFASQKLVMFLIAPGDTDASIVVKIARHPRYNDRLANESEMLRQLDRLGSAARGGAPSLRFEASAWGSSASAQSAVSGTDLRDHLVRRPELIERVTTWMVDLAEATRAPMGDGELGTALSELLDMYVGAYDVPAATEQFLRSQVVVLADASLDAVLQHGDPGPWNAVVTPTDEVAFLDWEAGETRGIPLWDLLYFLRSTSLLVSPNRPWQSRVARTRRDLVDGSPVGDLVATHVRAYAEAIGLDAEVVEPLFHLCWVHRAVKQARRLPAAERSRGTFHRLVLDGVEGRDQRGVRQITMRSDASRRHHD